MGWARAASLVVQRCGDGERISDVWPWPRLRHGALWLTLWVELAGGLGRIHPEGAAVLCLEPSRLRDSPRFVAVCLGAGASVALAIVVLGALWWPLYVPVVVIVAMLVGGSRLSASRYGTQAAALDKAEPAGARRLVNLAGDPNHKGAGRELVQEVCAEADRQGWVLYLDTTAPRLVEYYQGFGFEAVAVADYGRYQVTRMVRRCRPGSPPASD